MPINLARALELADAAANTLAAAHRIQRNGNDPGERIRQARTALNGALAEFAEPEASIAQFVIPEENEEEGCVSTEADWDDRHRGAGNDVPAGESDIDFATRRAG